MTKLAIPFPNGYLMLRTDRTVERYRHLILATVKMVGLHYLVLAKEVGEWR